jgi:hypothetical protein
MAVAAANTLTWEACRFDSAEVWRLGPLVRVEQVMGPTFE